MSSRDVIHMMLEMLRPPLLSNGYNCFGPQLHGSDIILVGLVTEGASQMTESFACSNPFASVAEDHVEQLRSRCDDNLRTQNTELDSGLGMLDPRG